MKIWSKTKEFSEGKYLVVRRDGTIPKWPHFVLGGDDLCARNALIQYAKDAEQIKLDPEYVESIRALAIEWCRRPIGKSDPDASPHRVDNPAIIAMMQGHGDLTKYQIPNGDVYGKAEAWITVYHQLESVSISACEKHDGTALGATIARIKYLKDQVACKIP
jgi:hypothetical protein